MGPVEGQGNWQTNPENYRARGSRAVTLQILGKYVSLKILKKGNAGLSLPVAKDPLWPIFSR